MKSEIIQPPTLVELFQSMYAITLEHAQLAILSQIGRIVKKSETGIPTQLLTLPGVSLGDQSIGPKPHKIMMLNCWPNVYENKAEKLFNGPWVDEFKAIAKDTGFTPHVSDIYLSTYCKYLIEGKKTGMPKEVVAEFKEHFLRELAIVNPDLLIVCGSKTLKAIFGSKATYEQYKNRTVPAADNICNVKVACIPDFSSILHIPEQREVIALDLKRIVNELGSPNTVSNITENYIYCDTVSDLAAAIAEIKSEYLGWLAVDCEWGGPNHLFGELRCIQFSWAPGKALVAIFSRKDLQPTELKNREQEAWKIIADLVEDPRTRLIGHFIRSDLPWLEHHGVNVTLPTLRGWDTALAGHLLNENWSQGLEVYTARHTDMGRYELVLTEWIKANKYDVETYSYGGIADEVLFPYAAKDADVTLRIALTQMEEMELPINSRIKNLFETIVMPATLPIMELETTGIAVDTHRLEGLSQRYTEKRKDLVEKLRDLLNWPKFNPDSAAQKAAALFTWVKKATPPTGANLATYMPIKATNDSDWAKAIANNKEDALVPSTDRSVLLGLLTEYKDCPLLNALLLYTAVSQTVKSFTGEFVSNDEDGSFSLQGGLLPKMWGDGKVHTKIRQTIETGRYGHSNPNMAQLPKTAEDLVGKAFAEDLTPIPSIRSCFVAEENWCIVDCDWVQAELFVMAWLSGDSVMKTKLLAVGSDFHSEVALQMFKLPLPPADYTKGKKDWLKDNNYIKFRTIAKTIVFGIAYGRGANAIKSAVSLEGVEITLEEAEAAVSAFKLTFPDLDEWLQTQQRNVASQGYVENGFGRKRRFEPTKDKENLAHQKRQAMNAPIQGTVGDLMSLALINLYMIREAEKPYLKYKIIMSVHDQILVTCPIDQVDQTLEVVKMAMCDRCTIPNNDLALNIDSDITLRWGEALTQEDIKKYPDLAKFKK